MDVRAKVGDSRLNGNRIIRISDLPDQFHTLLCSTVIAFCSRLEASSSFVRPIMPDKYAKCRDPRLKGAGEIRPKVVVVVGIIFEVFFHNNFSQEAVSDVISSVAVG